MGRHGDVGATGGRPLDGEIGGQRDGEKGRRGDAETRGQRKDRETGRHGEREKKERKCKRGNHLPLES